MEYKIVSGTTIGELTRLVSEEMKMGWKPQGGVCTWRTTGLILQAMVK